MLDNLERGTGEYQFQFFFSLHVTTFAFCPCFFLDQHVGHYERGLLRGLPIPGRSLDPVLSSETPQESDVAANQAMKISGYPNPQET